jgi:hypothetical protein
MISTSMLLRDVSRVSGIPLRRLTSKTRAREVAWLRHAVMFVLNRKGKFAPGWIAHTLKFERTSVRHGVDRCLELLTAGDRLMRRYYRIAIRCFVKERRREQERRAAARRLAEGVTHVEATPLHRLREANPEAHDHVVHSAVA